MRRWWAFGVMTAGATIAACESVDVAVVDGGEPSDASVADAPSRGGEGGPADAEALADVADASLESGAGDAAPITDAQADAPDPDAGDGSRTAAPTFAPPPGLYDCATVILSSATPDATLHYTTDGTTPTTASPLYATPLLIGRTTTLRAVAVAPGLEPSDVVVGTYVSNSKVGAALAAPVVFAPASGTYGGSIDVTLTTTTAPSAICVTFDGSAPSCDPDAGPIWCGIQLSGAACNAGSTRADPGASLRVEAPAGGGAVTVKARTCAESGFTSDVTLATYTFTP